MVVLPDLLQTEEHPRRVVRRAVGGGRVGLDPEVVPTLDARVVAGLAEQRAARPGLLELGRVHDLRPRLAEVVGRVHAVQHGGDRLAGHGRVTALRGFRLVEHVRAAVELLRVLHQCVDGVGVLPGAVGDGQGGAALHRGGRQAGGAAAAGREVSEAAGCAAVGLVDAVLRRLFARGGRAVQRAAGDVGAAGVGVDLLPRAPADGRDHRPCRGVGRPRPLDDNVGDDVGEEAQRGGGVAFAVGGVASRARRQPYR